MIKKFLLLLVAFTLVGFTHKFYVSINQVDYNQSKKRLEITSRFFLDDINNVLKKTHNKDFYIGDKKESQQEVELLKTYFKQNFEIFVNNKKVNYTLHNKELDDDVLVCYFLVNDVNKINSIKIKNTILMDLEDDQQNIHHFNIYQKKHTKLLTKSNQTLEINFKTK